MTQIVRFTIFSTLVLSALSACSTHVVAGNIEGVQSARIEAGPNIQLRKVDGEDLSNYWSRRWRGEAKSVDVAPGKHIVNAYWSRSHYGGATFTRRRDYQVIALPGHTYRLESEHGEDNGPIHVLDITNK